MQIFGGKSAIESEGPNGAELWDFFLQRRSTTGLCPNENQMLSNMDAEVNNGFLEVVFTRKMEGGGLLTLTGNGVVGAI